jgi:hypothetical protein
MRNVLAMVVLAAALGGCGAADLISMGLQCASAVETDLQQAIGIKPNVGFNWSNGRFRSVTVAFPRVYDEKPLAELAAVVRAAVGTEFKQMPDTIVLSFNLDK